MKPTMCCARMLALATYLFLATISLGAAEWFVATNGISAAEGSQVAPWDLASALNGRQRIRPGDTVWIGPGTYKFPPQIAGKGFPVKLAGRPGTPIYVRAQPDKRVIIDGGLSVEEPATAVWLCDLEILVSEPRPAQAVPPDPTYRSVNRPWGGLNISSGSACKFINLIIHDNLQGVSWWSSSEDSELYGCIIYDNGWAGTDRGHGHAIYTQNRNGVKAINDCIMTGGFGYTMHAYGSERAYVDNYLVQGNIVYQGGTFLIGGGKASRQIRVFTNFLHGVTMQLGYTAPDNEDCVVRGNIISQGTLEINKFKHAACEENLVVPDRDGGGLVSKVVLRPNKYDPRRAHLAVFNGTKAPVVNVDPGSFLRPGEFYRLLNPRDLWGKPILAGRHEGRSWAVPVAGEFAAFVLLKGSSDNSAD